MDRVEQATDESGAAWAQFQRALMLEEEVRERTRDLERTLDLLNQSNARLSLAMTEAEAARADLADAIESVREGFALFGSDDRLVLTNSRFCETLPDLRAHLAPGLRFVEYIRRAAASPHLALPDGRSRPEWMRERLRHHRLPSATFNVQTAADRWVQVSEQRTPGGGTAILHTDITELIQLERQERDKLLDEQAILIRATLDHVDQGIAIFDAEGRLVGWNSRLRTLLAPPMQLLRVGLGFAAFADHLAPRRSPATRLRPSPPGSRASAAPPLALDLRTRSGASLDLFGPRDARPRLRRQLHRRHRRARGQARARGREREPRAARSRAHPRARRRPRRRPSAPTPRSRASSPRRATTCSSR